LETIAKKLYEGMFLVDSAEAAADWDKVETSIKNILVRAEVEIVSVKKWDERKLAYEIGGKSRGTYILCYFRADGERIRDIERDVQLSELIMRVLILSAEHITFSQEDIEKETPAMLVERQKREAAEAAVEVAGPEQASAEQASAMTDAALEVSEEGAEESAVSKSDSESDKTDVEAEARESEEPQADEMKTGSEFADEQDADEQDAEKNEEK